MVNSKCFLPFGFFSPNILADWGVAYVRIAWKDNSATIKCLPIVFILFSDIGGHESVLKVKRNYQF